MDILTSQDTHTIGSAVELPIRTVAGSAADADGCIGPAVSAQVRPLMQTPQRVSSLQRLVRALAVIKANPGTNDPTGVLQALEAVPDD